MSRSSARVLAVVPARGGSRGIPNKNLVDVAGRPLLAWTVDAALGADAVDRVVVSSDSTRILAAARKLGAEALRRPPELATDTALSEPVVAHALDALEDLVGWVPDVTLLLQPTSPLRTASDVDAALAMLEGSPADAVISVFTPPCSPYKCFYRRADGGLSGVVSDEAPFTPRQELPRAWMPNGAIYAVRTPVFRRTGRLLGPYTLPYEMSPATSVDVDDPEDLALVERRLSLAQAC